MKRFFWAAGLLAAVTAVDVNSVGAADLDAPSRYGSPYDDPRYGDVYRVPERRYAEPRYEERYEEHRYEERRGPPPYSDRDDCRDCGPPPPARYSEVEPRYQGPGYGGRNQYCLPRPEIKEGLLRSGWRDFQDPALREHVAWLTARRPSGQLFRIKIDRCTGVVLRAQPIDGPAPAPWAYQGRRYDRQYWN